ncbi:MAG: hydantoinase/oxoprolinase family protein, partial [Pseudomonadota bacterium]
KFVSRGDTTVVDAYLSPILRRYVDRVAADMGDTRLMFMQSNGGLTDARLFQGKDAILSGPAGGIVGAVQTAARAGFEKIISFDMGGTSTDVAHSDGEYERAFETLVAGVRMRAPMMQIHTVAAGGGSILQSLRDNPDAPRVIVYTGSDDRDLPRKVMSLGAAGFFSKDRHPDQLVEAAHAVAGGQMVFPYVDVRELTRDP